MRFFTCCTVLQLCYKQLIGSIPTQLGDLKKLSVLALQSNLLGGAIPASLGDLGMLMRLDLSSNNLFGSIPTKLADLPLLQVLDVHNNTLSGNVPPGNNDATPFILFYCFCPFLQGKNAMSNATNENIQSQNSHKKKHHSQEKVLLIHDHACNL